MKMAVRRGPGPVGAIGGKRRSVAPRKIVENDLRRPQLSGVVDARLVQIAVGLGDIARGLARDLAWGHQLGPGNHRLNEGGRPIRQSDAGPPNRLLGQLVDNPAGDRDLPADDFRVFHRLLLSRCLL